MSRCLWKKIRRMTRIRGSESKKLKWLGCTKSYAQLRQKLILIRQLLRYSQT